MLNTGYQSRAESSNIKVSGLTGAVQSLVRILRRFRREICVVDYSYARSQRTQQ
jgi:hypothetical protein